MSDVVGISEMTPQPVLLGSPSLCEPPSGTGAPVTCCWPRHYSRGSRANSVAMDIPAASSQSIAFLLACVHELSAMLGVPMARSQGQPPATCHPGAEPSVLLCTGHQVLPATWMGSRPFPIEPSDESPALANPQSSLSDPERETQLIVACGPDPQKQRCVGSSCCIYGGLSYSNQ